MAPLAAAAITAAHGQQDLDAGKSGPQLFAQDCAACHRSPLGLVKTVSANSLVGFLRQHYTSSATSANAVAAYILANGGTARPERQKDQARQPSQERGRAARQAEPAGRPPAQVPSAQT